MAVPLAGLAQGQQLEPGFVPLTDWVVIDGPESAYSMEGGVVAVHSHATFPTWLRSAKRYSNFDLRGEFLIKGWTDSGIYLRAPEHGRPTQAGLQIKVFHQKEVPPTPYSMGAVFPVLAPRNVNVREGWNEFRVVCDGARVRVWTNGEMVQDVDLAAHSELKLRLREGYLGIVAASAECRFRGLRVQELPGTPTWQTLYETPGDLAANWAVSEGKPDFVALGSVLRGDGAGHMATKEKYRDFEFECYIRGCAQHNGGVLFRSAGRGLTPDKHYEIQLHPVEEAHFPTGSLYHLKRARYPRIEDERWFLFELWVQGRSARVRVDGETVMEYSELTILNEGFIELQAHRQGYWLEFKHVRVRRL
jgi:hypothetical protein